MNDASISASESQSAMLETVKQYFTRSDAGRADTLDLFADNVQIYFPKFGIVQGKAAFGELTQGLQESISALSHNIAAFRFFVTRSAVVVEGTTAGVDREGRTWAAGETPGGRFCSVFEFRDGLIARMHIYLDPDYTGRDRDRFLWGADRQW